MFNKQILMVIENATPYSKESKKTGKVGKGMKVTGVVSVVDKDFFADLDVGPERQRGGLDQILNGYLPIEGDLQLKFVKRKDLVIKLAKGTEQKVEIKKISLRTPGKKHKYEVKFQMLLPNVSAKVASHIIEKFKESELLSIEATNLDMEFKEREVRKN